MSLHFLGKPELGLRFKGQPQEKARFVMEQAKLRKTQCKNVGLRMASGQNNNIVYIRNIKSNYFALAIKVIILDKLLNRFFNL